MGPYRANRATECQAVMPRAQNFPSNHATRSKLRVLQALLRAERGRCGGWAHLAGGEAEHKLSGCAPAVRQAAPAWQWAWRPTGKLDIRAHSTHTHTRTRCCVLQWMVLERASVQFSGRASQACTSWSGNAAGCERKRRMREHLTESRAKLYCK